MQRFMALAVVFTFSLSGCLSQTLSNPTAEETMTLETTPCNGMIILCHRTYDNVTFPKLTMRMLLIKMASIILQATIKPD